MKLARLWFIRTTDAPCSSFVHRNSYEDINEAIEHCLSPVAFQTRSTGTLVVLSVRTDDVLCTVKLDARDDEDGWEQALNEISEALEKDGYPLQTS